MRIKLSYYYNPWIIELPWWKRLWTWVCDFPGVEIDIGKTKIYLLEWYMGHPWDRVYIYTPRLDIILAPFSKVQKYDKATGKYTNEFGRYRIRKV